MSYTLRRTLRQFAWVLAWVTVLSAAILATGGCKRRSAPPGPHYYGDLDHFFTWAKRPLSVWVDPAGLPDNDARRDTKTAMDTIEEATGGIADFAMTEQVSADIRVRFVSAAVLAQWPGARRGHVEYNHTDANEMIHVDVYIHEALTGSDRLHTLLHELFHAIGPYGHSKHKGDLLYREAPPTQRVAGIPPRQMISNRDVETLRIGYEKAGRLPP